MKRLCFIIVCLLLGAAVLHAQAPITLDIRYESKNKIDIALYAIEETFLREFPALNFISAGDKEAAGKTIRIEMACVEISQFASGKKKYEIYTARLKGKITIRHPDGTILYSRDLELIREAGSTPIKAELAGLGVMKKTIAQVIKDEKEQLSAILK